MRTFLARRRRVSSRHSNRSENYTEIKNNLGGEVRVTRTLLNRWGLLNKGVHYGAPDWLSW